MNIITRMLDWLKGSGPVFDNNKHALMEEIATLIEDGDDEGACTMIRRHPEAATAWQRQWLEGKLAEKKGGPTA